MEAKVYNQDGQITGKVELPTKIFGVKWNADMVHQVVTSLRSAARVPWANAKTRAEVRGGGKKPWKQKGTGRARHGSTRSPIWRHGGSTHGPLAERDYDRKVNKKMKTKALFAILSAKFKDGEIIFIDKFDFGTAPKTKKAATSILALSKVGGYEKIAYRKGNRALILLNSNKPELVKSFRNIKSAKVEEMRNVNPADAIAYKYIVIEQPEKGVESLTRRA